jgi:hypothetical protein
MGAINRSDPGGQCSVQLPNGLEQLYYSSIFVSSLFAFEP